MQAFDALIIGAGPAGAFAAQRLAQAGMRVALFDGRSPSDPKPCGGGVTAKALRRWPWLLEAPARVIADVRLLSPSGRALDLRLWEPFAIYSRRAFDHFLRQRAERFGATVLRDRVKDFARAFGAWSVKTGAGKEYRADFLVVADGANSPFARRLAGRLSNFDMEVAFGYRAPLPSSGRAETVIAFLKNWAGYAWAFPRLDHVCFGIATGQTSFDRQALDRLLWKFMLDYYGAISPEQVESRLRSLVVRYAARIPGLRPESWEERVASGDGWALLGDAAGFADPVTGEGIYYALRSAELLAESLISGEARSYEERWREDFGRELRRAAQMRDRFYGGFLGAPFTDRMIAFARLHRGVRRTLRELIAGDQGYVDLKGRLVQRLFAVAFV